MNMPERIVTAKKNPAQGRVKSSLGQPLENILVCNCHAMQNTSRAHCFGDAAASAAATQRKKQREKKPADLSVAG
jgi:hypothetical protein